MLENTPGPIVSEIEDWLVERFVRLAGLSTDDINPMTPIGDFALCSTHAAGISEELETRFRMPASATLVWEHPTIRSIAEHLAAVDKTIEHTLRTAGMFDGMPSGIERAADTLSEQSHRPLDR